MTRQKFLLACILVVIAGFYAQVTSAYFCGFDDFSDIHRAMFEDARDPLRILTTTHFGTSKYRPIQRAATYVTWNLGAHRAWVFRVRNLSFHLLNVALVYGICLLLGGAPLAAAGAALLFGLHPLANQAVVAAIWVNTMSYSFVLGAFYLFLGALYGKRGNGAVAAALALLGVGLFCYEPVVVGYGLLFGYAGLWWLRNRSLPRGMLAVLVGGTAPGILALYIVRRLFVSQASPVTPLAIMVRNILMFSGSLALPVDTVFAHTVFGTPLPSELKITRALLLTGGIAAAIVAGLAVVLFRSSRFRASEMRARIKALDWPVLVFLAAAIPALLAPFVVFTPHPSETYLYGPSAFFAILVSLTLKGLAKNDSVYIAIVAVLAVSFGAGVWERNRRVTACGTIAETILEQLPISQWRQGEWHILLANRPGDPQPLRYGIYGYAGLSTIDPGEPGINATQAALQMASGNEQMKAAAASPGQLENDCSAPEICYWIASDGAVQAMRR